MIRQTADLEVRSQLGCMAHATHVSQVCCTVVTFSVLSLPGVCCADEPDLPNIIFLLTDDQGIDAVQGAQWPNLLNCHTPTLAGLASHGRTFNFTRVAPSCSPTRASLLTGRQPLKTGVMFRLNNSDESRLVRLEEHEHTVAEMLQEAGYYTILMDKWHVGGAPLNQGFDFFLPSGQILHLDDPIEVGDEHITRSVNFAERLVLERPDPTAPYALFFWTIDPHYRKDHSGREQWGWWKVDESLLPSGEDYYCPNVDSPRNRYRAVVESVDTEFGRMLRDLGVMNTEYEYLADSNTIVFFMGDNGTPEGVSMHPDRTKRSLFELGIRVPFVAFGEKVPADGAILDRLVSHVDLYDTIGDIIGTPIEERGVLPRDGMSFSDAIGWSQARPERQFTLSNLGGAQPEQHRVALANTRFKLIARGGGAGLSPLSVESFFDMQQNPGERRNLLRSPMTRLQRGAFLVMRDALPDYWNSSVSELLPNVVDIPITHIIAMTSSGSRHTQTLPLGFDRSDDPNGVESRVFVRFAAGAIDSLLPGWATIDDVIAAQIIPMFRSDSEETDETDTGPIHAYRMLGNWYSREVTWEQVVNGHDDNTALGMIDLPAHVIPDLSEADLSGIPISDLTPLSLGHSAELLDLVRLWHDRPDLNHGLVLMADVVEDIGDDQSVFLRRAARLRLTLRSW